MALPRFLAFALLLLQACAAPNLCTGTTTSLRAGEMLEVRVGGRDAAVRVRTEGPGQLTLVQEGPPATEIGLGVPGNLTLRGPVTFRLRNGSGAEAGVAITATGADEFQVRPCREPAPASR